MHQVSTRLLTLLQLTRMALVFTAISNAQASLLMQRQFVLGEGWVPAGPGWVSGLLMALVSIGLYGFGMSLNDIIDRRRDEQLAGDRPLPSGRISVWWAQLICLLLALIAAVAGVFFAFTTADPKVTLILLLGVASLIVFYDFAGKYLVVAGLITLGLIRFFQAVIASPTLPMPWHPLLLLNHVAVLSMVCYVWEQKRPALRPRHVWKLSGGLALLNAMVIGGLAYRRVTSERSFAEALWVTPKLLLPAAAIVGFVVVAAIIRRNSRDGRGAGKTLMLVGLLWLIVYDAAFVWGHVDWWHAVLLLLLLPIAWLSVRLMRAWSKLVMLSQPPQYIRAT